MRSRIFIALASAMSSFAVAGCGGSGDGSQNNSDLPNSFTYGVSTDEFEKTTTSFATQWYPSEGDADVDHMVWFRCVAEPLNQTLELFIENVKIIDDEAVTSGHPFNNVRIKFDDSTPVQIYDGFATDQLRITYSSLQKAGELRDAKNMSIRVDNFGYENYNSNFTVSVNLKNDAIQNVFNDCKQVFDQAG